VAFLARLNTHRTLAEHLQRVAFVPVFHLAQQQQQQQEKQQQLGGLNSSSSNIAGQQQQQQQHHQPQQQQQQPGAPSTSLLPTSSGGVSLSTVQRELQAEFMEQLLFMLRRQWVRQVQRWIVRVEEQPDSSDEEEDDDEEDEEADDSEHEHDDNQKAASGGKAAPPTQLSSELAAGKSAGEPESEAGEDPWHSLLDRLTPLYFDGRHSLTEILYHERDTGLTLAHLQHLTSLYPTQLFMLQHM
jgi:hypothetical protein